MRMLKIGGHFLYFPAHYLDLSEGCCSRAHVFGVCVLYYYLFTYRWSDQSCVSALMLFKSIISKASKSRLLSKVFLSKLIHNSELFYTEVGGYQSGCLLDAFWVFFGEEPEEELLKLNQIRRAG